MGAMVCSSLRIPLLKKRASADRKPIAIGCFSTASCANGTQKLGWWPVHGHASAGDGPAASPALPITPRLSAHPVPAPLLRSRIVPFIRISEALLEVHNVPHGLDVDRLRVRVKAIPAACIMRRREKALNAVFSTAQGHSSSNMGSRRSSETLSEGNSQNQESSGLGLNPFSSLSSMPSWSRSGRRNSRRGPCTVLDGHPAGAHVVATHLDRIGLLRFTAALLCLKRLRLETAPFRCSSTRLRAGVESRTERGKGNDSSGSSRQDRPPA